MSELQVSDVYVRLGNDFNAAVSAFQSHDIDMRCAFMGFSTFFWALISY
jgi:hypothetical protein